MRETRATQGNAIAYEETGTVVSFNDGELMLNLAKYERDFPVTIDLCRNDYGNLVVGIDEKKGAYAAQIAIPARKYDIAIGEPDDNGVPTEIRKPVKLNMDNVIIHLWGEV